MFGQLAMGLDLDVMVLDFEDGVALNQKAKARQLVAETLRNGEFGRTERTVRINSIKAGEELYVKVEVEGQNNDNRVVEFEAHHLTDDLWSSMTF